MQELKPKLTKTELRAWVTLILLVVFLASLLYLLIKADKVVQIDTDTFKLLLQTLLTLLSVAVGGWLFKERE